VISLEEVRQNILERIPVLPAEEVDLHLAGGRTLARSVQSTDAIPPFDNTAMDGFVVRFEDIAEASEESPVTLPVTAIIEAGMPGDQPLNPGEAMRIYTGAVIPPGGTAVVPFEICQQEGREAVTFTRPAADGAHIRRQGEDVPQGGDVLSAGTRLSPAAIGLLASVGATRVSVYQAPRVAVHSSGNELVPIDSALTPGKIRNSNLYSLCARLNSWGAIAVPRPVLSDDLESIRLGLQETLDEKPDAIITTGGISAGDLDYIREVAREMGEDVHIRKVAMKPGKPLVDGTLGGVPFFGLPGNPAACLVSFEMFVRPALARMEGRKDGMPPMRSGVLAEGCSLGPGQRMRWLRGRAQPDPAGGPDKIDLPTGQGSHLLTGFSTANCLVHVPASETELAAGSSVEYWSLTEEEA
jgi:molybdopterin molybdotransferase